MHAAVLAWVFICNDIRLVQCLPQEALLQDRLLSARKRRDKLQEGEVSFEETRLNTCSRILAYSLKLWCNTGSCALGIPSPIYCPGQGGRTDMEEALGNARHDRLLDCISVTTLTSMLRMA